MLKALKIPLILLIILSFTSLSGCWSKRELNEIAILTAAGVDLASDKNEINFVYQVVNPSAILGKGVSSMKTPFITLETSGETLLSAARKGTRELSRELYFGHLQDYVISSAYAKEKGVKELLELLYRSHELREDILLFIAKEQTAKEILSTQTVLEMNTGVSIQKHLQNTYQNDGCSRPVQLREIINYLTSETSHIAIPTVQLSPPDMESNIDMTQKAEQDIVIKVGGFAIFNKDKLIGFINTKDARSLNFITDYIEKTIIVVPYKGFKNSVELLNSKTTLKTSIKNGRPEVLIEIKNSGNIGEVNSPVDLNKPSVIKDFEKGVNQVINDEVSNFIQKVQETYQVDIFKFGEAIERQHPKEWKQLKKDWDTYFRDLKVEVKVTTIIREIGMKNVPFQFEMKGSK